MSIGCGYLVIDVEIYSNGQPKALKALVIGVGENQMTIVKKNVLWVCWFVGVGEDRWWVFGVGVDWWWVYGW